MEIQEYLLDKLKNCASYELTVEDKKLLNDFGIEGFIYKKITSKKFRKYALPSDYQKHIMKVIHESMAVKQKISFVWVFGGYKLWRLVESPEPDWAELFSMIYFIDWLKPITVVYPPGVHFDFFSDDVIVPIMNNILQEDTRRYIVGFKNLLDFIKPYLPENFLFTLNRVEDQYENYNEFKKDLETEISKRTEELGGVGKFSSLTPEQVKAIELNVRPNPGKIEDSFWREKVQLIHDSYTRISKRRPYYRNENKIMVITSPIPGAIAVGSTKTSITKFWTGVGVLETRENGFSDRILSPEQWERAKSTKHEIVNSDIIPFKNFKEILVFPDRFDFRH